MKFSALATLAALAVAQPASAAFYQVTMTGTLTEGFDKTGMFGAPNSDLAGLGFSAVEYFDLDKVEFGSLGESLWGGTSTSNPVQVATGVLTINGVSVEIDGTYFAYITKPNLFNSIGFVQSDEFVGSLEVSDYLSLMLNNHPAISAPLATLPEWHGDCHDGVQKCQGSFGFGTYEAQPGGDVKVYRETTGQFAGDTFDVRVVSGVPEPATWAMMIVGFGLVGSALRRRVVATA